jgi:hypothetical protein
MNGRYCDNFEKCGNKAAPGHDLCYTCLVERERQDKRNERIVDRLEQKPHNWHLGRKADHTLRDNIVPEIDMDDLILIAVVLLVCWLFERYEGRYGG